MTSKQVWMLSTNNVAHLVDSSGGHYICNRVYGISGVPIDEYNIGTSRKCGNCLEKLELIE